ncbi:hypothetical protein JB92DRAFT_1461889 [Gautieria morchelliformis]|nr:hypothetical protein JB92DRAFT_1461889 [Gautieria morchelliformis]
MLLSLFLGFLLPQLVTSGTVSSTTFLAPRFSSHCVSHNADPSCTPLIGSCMDQITTANINNSWSIRSCVAAATCYGGGNLIGAVCCQTGLCPHPTHELSLDYVNVYAPIVGSCAFASGGCPITQKKYIDFYYGSISAINSTIFPVSSSIVIALWSSIVSWTGFCGSNCSTGSVPYLNFNDWLHLSSSFTPVP